MSYCGHDNATSKQLRPKNIHSQYHILRYNLIINREKLFTLVTLTSRELLKVVRLLREKFGEREPFALTERKSLAVAVLRRNNLKSGEPGNLGPLMKIVGQFWRQFTSPLVMAMDR